MSAATVQPGSVEPDAGEPLDRGEGAETRVVGRPVVVRRNAGLAALIGAGASAIAIAYLWRAGTSGSPLDWAMCLLMAVVAVLHLAHLVDARTPLLVADDLGVRIRLGGQWRGLPWDAVGSAVVTPRRGLLGDGRLMFAPHSLERALDGLDSRGRRSAALNRTLYGAELAVPLGLTTRVSAAGQDLTDDLTLLARDRAAVVVKARPVVHGEPAEPAEPVEPLEGFASVGAAGSDEAPEPLQPVQPVRALGALDAMTEPESSQPSAVPADPDVPVEPAEPAEGRPARRSLLGGLGTVVSRIARGRRRDVDSSTAPAVAEPTGPESGLESDPATGSSTGRRTAAAAHPAEDAAPAPRAAVPLRGARRGLRAQVTRSTTVAVDGATALLHDEHTHGRGGTLPEGRELRRQPDPDSDDATVRPIAALGDPVGALVVDDFVVEPASDPVIGPELAAARTRVGLSVDELAERTRIRPHVIESIEVDDFVPCGGDFYARGHLRTLARVLGRDPVPLLEQFDHRYATAPINARRVFEAEMATGMTAGSRRTVGGPNWALLVGVVLALVMTWGVVRLFAAEPEQVLRSPVPSLNGSAGVGNAGVAPAPVVVAHPVAVTLVGARNASQVVVRDRGGKIVWAGRVALGETRTVRATPPVRVEADDAGAVEVSVNGVDRGPLGPLGAVATRTFRPATTR